MADFIVGSPARDDDFLFREEFVESLWEALNKHNILLLAPRRTGKTSVMYRMLDKPRDGWLVIHLNVEDLKTPVDFVISLIDAINEHQPRYLKEGLAKGWDFLSGVLSRVEKIEVSEFKIQLRKSDHADIKWQERGTELIERVFKTSEKVLFIIDELPDMLGGMRTLSLEEYADFLHWFRKIRERSLKNDLRWLVGGSVNLIATLDQQGMVKLVNDLKVEPLPSFSEEEVENFRMEERRSEARTGPALSQAFQRLLLHMQSDFYIEQRGDGNLDFASRLLKRWWKKYYAYECEGK